MVQYFTITHSLWKLKAADNYKENVRMPLIIHQLITKVIFQDLTNETVKISSWENSMPTNQSAVFSQISRTSHLNCLFAGTSPHKKIN